MHASLYTMCACRAPWWAVAGRRRGQRGGDDAARARRAGGRQGGGARPVRGAWGELPAWAHARTASRMHGRPHARAARTHACALAGRRRRRAAHAARRLHVTHAWMHRPAHLDSLFINPERVWGEGPLAMGLFIFASKCLYKARHVACAHVVSHMYMHPRARRAASTTRASRSATARSRPASSGELLGFLGLKKTNLKP